MTAPVEQYARDARLLRLIASCLGEGEPGPNQDCAWNRLRWSADILEGEPCPPRHYQAKWARYAYALRDPKWREIRRAKQEGREIAKAARAPLSPEDERARQHLISIGVLPPDPEPEPEPPPREPNIYERARATTPRPVDER